MNTINGFSINFDFSKLIKVADLIYYDGPLLSHYVSNKGENYLFYWVDVDNEYNRWVVIRTDIFSIQQYLEKKSTLHSIITQPNDGFVYTVDIDDKIHYHNIKLVPIANLPEEYTPTENSYYAFEIEDTIDLAAISQKYSSGILEIHISGKDVKYGSIPLNKFAPIIPKIEDIRKSMSSKFIKRVKHSNTYLERNAKQNIDRELRLDTQYEYMYSLAGSIRIILKPINQQTSFSTTYSDDFAQDLIQLFKAGYDKKSILDFSGLYDKNILKKYNDFVSFLNEESLAVGIKWYNANSKTSYKQDISTHDTKKILANLSDFEFDNKEEIRLCGRFYSINIRTGNYAFESAEGDDFKSIGFLDETRRQMAYNIAFNKTYQVVIERKTIEPIGGKEKIKDILISFVEAKSEKPITKNSLS